MVILGIDPGIARCGFGVITDNHLVACGCLTTEPHHAEQHRLVTLGQAVDKLIILWQPDIAVIERVFFGRAAKTAMLTAQVNGMLRYVLGRRGVETVPVTPPQVKRYLVGNQRATKTEIQSAVMHRLGLPAVLEPDDTADAVAAALWLADHSSAPK